MACTVAASVSESTEVGSLTGKLIAGANLGPAKAKALAGWLQAKAPGRAPTCADLAKVTADKIRSAKIKGLPIASLEDPLTAARVESLKRQGRDWFRTLLLPEALAILIPAIASLRRSGGRLAILDGRVRGRSWGEQVLRALEPWDSLQRLRPD